MHDQVDELDVQEDPSYQHTEEFLNRLRKLWEIKDLGVDPYPHKFIPTHRPVELLRHYKGDDVGMSMDAEENKTELVRMSGRLVLFRAMGKNAFAQLQGEHGRIQIMFNRDRTHVAGYDSENCSNVAQPPSHIKFIEKRLDLGDILGVEGHLFRTKKGELTVYVKRVTLLCKTLLPLPDKHAGLVDMEVRYRKRWLDLIANEDVRETFRTRSHIMRMVRAHCENLDFLEVETPILQNIYGGAAARPFKTAFHALDDEEMFLRISLEIPLKKLLVGGMSKVFELGKVFRNESIDRTHNPEFTMLEAYAAYWDYHDMMIFVETLFENVSKKLFGKTKFELSHKGEDSVEIDVKAPWKRLSMKGSIKEYANIDVDVLSEDEMREALKGVEGFDVSQLPKASRGDLIALLFEEFVEHHLIQPHHIIDHPIETTPLCKLHRDSKEREDGIVERFESFICGQEICNAYSELNDPILQRELLEKQSSKRDLGDEEANPLDEDFIEAICQGMPPAGGVGIGIDRMVMLFTSASSIRDVLYFPFMKNEA